MTKEEAFWQWFTNNNSKYYYINQLKDSQEKERLLSLFLEKLHEYNDGLFFEIGGAANEAQELIITSEGNKDHYSKVEMLVSKAPKINDWIIQAFKPPMGIDFITEYEGVKLDPHKIWFLPLDNKHNPKALGLKLFIPNFNLKNETKFLAGSYKMLDTILGEKSVALNIHHVEVDSLPHKPEQKGLIELSDLTKYIDWRNENR